MLTRDVESKKIEKRGSPRGLDSMSSNPPNVFVSIFEFLMDLLKSTILSLPFFNESIPGVVLLLGLDYAGKTTLSAFLSAPPGTSIPTLKPTVRPSSRSFNVGSKTFLAYDMGGCEGVREAWGDYLALVEGGKGGVIFMVDATTIEDRESELREELEGVLETLRDSGQGQIAVVFNKVDRKDVSLSEVMEVLGIEDGEEEGVELKGFKSSVINGVGVEEVFQWLGSSRDT